ncbi:hypothetical protein H4R35_003351 [Dimargaris xerosporica]|nr:hypothetical protein H4R35_003351 [Dimargaris xerosporica]
MANPTSVQPCVGVSSRSFKPWRYLAFGGWVVLVSLTVVLWTATAVHAATPTDDALSYPQARRAVLTLSPTSTRDTTEASSSDDSDTNHPLLSGKVRSTKTVTSVATVDASNGPIAPRARHRAVVVNHWLYVMGGCIAASNDKCAYVDDFIALNLDPDSTSTVSARSPSWQTLARTNDASHLPRIYGHSMEIVAKPADQTIIVVVGGIVSGSSATSPPKSSSSSKSSTRATATRSSTSAAPTASAADGGAEPEEESNGGPSPFGQNNHKRSWHPSLLPWPSTLHRRDSLSSRTSTIDTTIQAYRWHGDQLDSWEAVGSPNSSVNLKNSARTSHASVWVPSLNKVLIHGGQMVDDSGNGTIRNDLLLLDTSGWQWTAPSSRGAPFRQQHVALMLNATHLVLVGGMDRQGLASMDALPLLDVKTMAWSTLAVDGASPARRRLHSAVMVKDQIVVYGGANADIQEIYGDVAVLTKRTENGADSAWHWKSVSPTNAPAGRLGHAAVVVGSHMLITFGLTESLLPQARSLQRRDASDASTSLAILDTTTWNFVASFDPQEALNSSDNSGDGLPPGAIIGIVATVLVGLILLLAIAWRYGLKKRYQRNRRRIQTRGSPGSPYDSSSTRLAHGVWNDKSGHYPPSLGTSPTSASPHSRDVNSPHDSGHGHSHRSRKRTSVVSPHLSSWDSDDGFLHEKIHLDKPVTNIHYHPPALPRATPPLTIDTAMRAQTQPTANGSTVRICLPPGTQPKTPTVDPIRGKVESLYMVESFHDEGGLDDDPPPTAVEPTPLTRPSAVSPQRRPLNSSPPQRSPPSPTLLDSSKSPTLPQLPFGRSSRTLSIYNVFPWLPRNRSSLADPADLATAADSSSTERHDSNIFRRYSTFKRRTKPTNPMAGTVFDLDWVTYPLEAPSMTAAVRRSHTSRAALGSMAGAPSRPGLAAGSGQRQSQSPEPVASSLRARQSAIEPGSGGGFESWAQQMAQNMNTSRASIDTVNHIYPALPALSPLSPSYQQATALYDQATSMGVRADIVHPNAYAGPANLSRQSRFEDLVASTPPLAPTHHENRTKEADAKPQNPVVNAVTGLPTRNSAELSREAQRYHNPLTMLRTQSKGSGTECTAWQSETGQARKSAFVVTNPDLDAQL